MEELTVVNPDNPEGDAAVIKASERQHMLIVRQALQDEFGLYPRNVGTTPYFHPDDILRCLRAAKERHEGSSN